ncbi:MAG TPA: hypothetical protein VF188_04805, partial [Longimicrobiales bacterium]
LQEMLGGPGRLRFIIQPLVAILLGIRDGRLDAKARRRPYVIAVLFVKEGRRAALRSGVATFIRPFAIAVLVDLILQFYVLARVRIWEAVVVGTALVAVPYVAARGLTNRLSR